jgi:integrase
VHDKWLTLLQQARQDPITTRVPRLDEFLSCWLDEVVAPNLVPLTHATYVGVHSTKWAPIELRNFNRSWDARCRKAGVRKITVHDGQRTYATILVDLDVHPREVMQILRHAQIAVTMEIYAQASFKATRATLKRLEDSLHG